MFINKAWHGQRCDRRVRARIQGTDDPRRIPCGLVPRSARASLARPANAGKIAVISNVMLSVAVIFGIIYLVVFYRFTFRFRALYPKLWKDLDSPESFGLRGQMTYLAVALGLERKAPLEKLQELRKELVVIRVSLGVSFTAFVITFILIS